MKQINILVTYRQKHNISFNHNNKTGYMHYWQINTLHYSVWAITKLRLKHTKLTTC